MSYSPPVSYIEPVGRIDILGHSQMAEGGATNISYGSMHKLAQMWPARFRNLAVGGGQAHRPGAGGPLTGGQTSEAGWGYIYDQYKCRERNTGLNTTLTGAGISAGQGIGVSTEIGSNSGWSVGQPVMVGRGATAEIAYVASSADATHVAFYQAFVNAHAAGEPVVAVPDTWVAARQFAIVEYDWNDAAKLGMTTWQTAFIHAYRAIMARFRTVCAYPADSVLVRETVGTWTETAAAAGFGSGGNYRTTTTAGNQLTCDIPVNFPGGTVVLLFLVPPNGDGANWTISVDGGAGVTFDTRNTNGFANGSTRAATGVWGPCVYRIKGLAAGAHTITVTATTITGTAYFDGFEIEAPEPPPQLVMLPVRLYHYGLYAGWAYQPVDADQATMATAIRSLIAEFDSTVVEVDPEPVINKQFKYFIGQDGAHHNDNGHAEKAILLIEKIRSQTIPLRNLILQNPVDTKGWYPIGAAGSGTPAELQNNWVAWSTTDVQPGYYKDIATGIVFVRGAVKLTGATQNPFLVICTLPVGHRPANDMDFVVATSYGPQVLRVSAAGFVSLMAGVGSGGTLSYVSLNFSFEAEQ